MTEDGFDLGSIGNDTFECSVEKFITSRTAVIGMSGSGKSHLIGVIAEELSEMGASFVIIDPEGEYSSLKEKYEVVWAGNDPEADVKLTRSSSKKLAQTVVEQNARLILDTSYSDDSKEELDVISDFLDHFYELETKNKKPILVIVEEADRFAPQFGGEKVKRLLEISRRGRKRGIGLLIATQRPQMVDKNVLSQCGNQLIGKLRTKNDMKAVDLFFSSSERIRSLPELRLGEFYAMGEFDPAGGLLKVKGRTTSSLGSTPDGNTRRKKKFSVDDFVSEISDDIPVRVKEKRPLIEEEKVKKGKKTRNKRSRSKIRGASFKIKEDRALKLAKDDIDRTLFTGKSKESLDSIEKIYWPFYKCTIIETRRALFRMKKKDHTAVLDPVLLRFIKFRNGHGQKELIDLDIRILDLWSSSRTDHWKDIRILRELQKEDMTSGDLAPAVNIGSGEVRSSIRSLKKKKLVSTVGKAGSSSVYRPLIKIREEEIKDTNTYLPSFREVDVRSGERMLKENIDEKIASDLVKGMFDNCELVDIELFHLPFYLVSLHHRKKKTARYLLLNGRTGEDREITEEEFKRLDMA
ncbi:MAG: DUF87 domain-containing protein [Candidatus Thermoplasmatota archaeon]|nr:DUF87 domain-containing protein [Candidatus Thermoplasmatota archaeon]